jgi:hypothetical protein
MDLITALESSRPAREEAGYILGASIEEGGEFPPLPVVPFGGVSGERGGAYSVNSPQHTKMVFAMVAGVFLFTAALACYLMMT